jgi:hypothetical protein
MITLLSSVLNSERAVEMNIFIIHAFVRLREILATHRDLAHKLQELEQTQQAQGAQIAALYDLVKRVMAPGKSRQRPIGFIVRERQRQWRSP